jgi:hypothetical protein
VCAAACAAAAAAAAACSYRTSVEEVPVGEYTIPLGQAQLLREGSDITLIGWGAQVSCSYQSLDATMRSSSAEPSTEAAHVGYAAVCEGSDITHITLQPGRTGELQLAAQTCFS